MSALDTALERFGSRRVQDVRPVPRAAAQGLVAVVYGQLAREYQLAPPLTVHSPAPRLLAAVWSATREALVVGADRVAKEAIAAAVSTANACPYCVDVHSVMLDAGSQRDAARAIGASRPEQVEDPALRRAAEWALATVCPGGAAPPFPAGEAAPYLATAVVFHYLNRVVNVFMREGSPLALPGGLGWLRAGVSRVAARAVGRPTLARVAAPGESLSLLGDLEVASGLGWADAHPAIGPALGRLFHVAREGVEPLLSPTSQRAVVSALAGWSGEAAPLGRRWLEEVVAAAPEEEAAAVRLALLVARASWALTDEDVAAFRAAQPADDALVRLVAWGAVGAAQRIATWLVT